MTRRSTRFVLALAAMNALGFGFASTSQGAVNRTWIATSGFWSGANNWSPSGVPQAADRVFLTQADGVNRIVQYNSVFFPQQPTNVLQINATGAGTMLLTQTAGYLVGDSLLVGTSGQGRYELNGGSANFTNAAIAAAGVVRIGELNFATLTIGSLTQNNGSLILASGGTLNILNDYQLNAGMLSGSKINSFGTFALNGGLYFASVNNFGTFLYNGGTTAGNPSVNNSGTFIYNNVQPFPAFIENHGAMLFNVDAQLGAIDSFSSFTLPAGRQLKAANIVIEAGTFTHLGNYTGDVGVFGGTWDQRSGQLATSSLNLTGFNISGGTFLLSGTANLFANTTGAVVGYSGNGTFLQSGGNASFGDIVVGGELFASSSTGYRGYLGISGGFLSAGHLMIGPVFAASATLNLSGGGLRAGTLTINENGGTTASATISGGSFSANYLHNFGTFTMSGGTGTSMFVDGVGTMNLSGNAHLVADLIRQQSLSLAGTASITHSLNFSFTDRVRSLKFDETGGIVHGSWDLLKDHLVIDYDGASPIATIRRYLISGSANGQWTGPGLHSSAAATAAPRNKALGYAEASQIFGANGGLFGALAVDDTSVLIRYTYYGDTDLNGVVNFDDYARIDAGFNNSAGPRDWFHGDFNYDGQVNFDDYALIDLAFNTQGASLRPNAVPEPAAIALGSLAILARGLRREQRRRQVTPVSSSLGPISI